MSEKLVIFVPTDFKPFKRVAHMFEMMTVQESNGKGIQSPNYTSTKGLHNRGNYI